MISNPFILSLIAFLMLGCKPESKDKHQNAGFQRIVQESPQQQEDLPVYYRFPSAREMLKYIKSDALIYRTDLINSTQYLDQYNDSRSQTSNLGVYLADFSYMILFGKTRQARDYFNAIVELTSDLRISIPEEDAIIQRISDNLHNIDSLIKISDDYQSYIIDYLIKTDREKTLALISTGSYIEGLYIALNMVTDYKKNMETLERIADQKYAFNHLMRFAKSFPEDVHTKYAIRHLQEINEHFNQLTISGEAIKSERTGSNRMVFKGGEQITMNKEQFEMLREKVTEIRRDIVKHNH